ncbi:hypothetical protein [Clostridium saccharoperbutylacetonicum]|jgi:methyl-accepting chemotaxis protein|uniref:hypothetical protein n=1 Tax=Clostridium saccharoperbutylacetonicum TaxID=36745 RepID=UPI000983A0C8|nr:hypothetical protein [Clostridium saccharoperbutylacetonicum]AQR97473.1 hypothetical protein CLSAP_47970 [Clostridium saccharoperbutylacetonicum]
MSGESAKKISDLLLEMRKSIDRVIGEINSTNMIAESQAADTEEITAALEEITPNYAQIMLSHIFLIKVRLYFLILL